jgi:predicted ATP-grasp superfamily ATP-dependent carboligase
MMPAAFRLIGMVGSIARMMVIRRVTSRRIAVMKLRLFPI